MYVYITCSRCHSKENIIIFEGDFEKIPALTTEGKNILPQYLVGKNVAKQHGCRDRFDQSQKVSWFDFQGLV
jgi:hypothetical protein